MEIEVERIAPSVADEGFLMRNEPGRYSLRVSLGPRWNWLTRSLEAFVVSVVLMSSSVCHAQTGGSGRDFEASPVAVDVQRREGTHLETIGEFQVTLDRATFQPQGEEEPIRVLENLALERVLITEQSSRGRQRTWQVRGKITEFRGKNYLLIEHAILAVPGEGS